MMTCSRSPHPPRRIMCGITARQHRKAPVRFCSSTRRHVASSVSSTVPNARIPAALNSISIPPKASSAAPAMPCKRCLVHCHPQALPILRRCARACPARWSTIPRNHRWDSICSAPTCQRTRGHHQGVLAYPAMTRSHAPRSSLLPSELRTIMRVLENCWRETVHGHDARDG